MDKASIRIHMATERGKMPPSQAETLSSKICLEILNMHAIKDSESIGIYFSFRNEVFAEKLISPLSNSGKKIFLPIVSKDADMKFALFKSLEDMVIGFHGMHEPSVKEFAKDGSIGAFIVPGLAFDLSGSRVGWGKGHYDKFLSQNKDAVKIGAAYDFQIIEKIDTQPHDVKMDFVVTEKRILKF